MDGNLRVERSGDLVVATLSGLPTEALLRECQQQVLQLLGTADRGRVLYDARAMEAPAVHVPWLQRELDGEPTARLRRAIVVSDTRVGFLARLAFGSSDYRVFYDDLEAATNWLGTAD